MATIHRGRAPDGRAVAIKRLDTRVKDQADRARFEREASIRFRHPNVVEVLDAGVDGDGAPYIVLELLEGGELETKLRDAPLPPKDAIGVGIQIARGLEVAHAAGVVHRDLKPSNIFICKDGTVKLLDFGVALLENRRTRFTSTGKVVGTPWYLAPEQARGDRDLDSRVDVWALGAVLYESLTGRAPFDRDSPLATVLAILREEPEPLERIVPSIPRELAAVIARCLVKPRDFRWATAGAVRAALEAIDVTDAAETAHSVDAPAAPTIAAGEDRIVAVLLAEGAEDGDKLRQAVEEEGGTFLRLYGHRAVGLFGGAQTEGDELERAASAAMRSAGAARHISVAAGRATSVGGTISGAAILAAEQGCNADVIGVAVDARSAKALTQRFDLESVAKGFYRLVAERPVSPIPPPRGSVVPGLHGDSIPPGFAGPIPLVGRTSELAQLSSAVTTMLGEWRARAVLMIGAAGSGKSRLRRELEQMLEQSVPPVRMLVARADPLGGSAALSLVAAAIRRRARDGTNEQDWPRIEPEAPLEERRRAVEALASEAITDPVVRDETTSFLGELLGVDMGLTSQVAAARTDPQLMADRLRVAVRDYFGGLADQGPVALLLEDLHWADNASLDVVEELLDGLSESPFLVAATARTWFDEGRPSYLGAQGVTRIEPRGLVAAEVAALAKAIAGRALSAPLVDALTERTSGNPLFVEQIVGELVEQGSLDLPPEKLPLPITVEAAIQSRLDHLPLLEKNACKHAAIWMRPFAAEEVEALGIADARGLLESLRRRRIVAARSAARVGRAREYRFHSTLFADVAYAMLAEAPRAELHRRAASILARAVDADDEEIGGHHEKAGENDQAVTRYVAATLAAQRRGDGESVLRCSGRALALGVPDAQRYDVHMARADAMQFLGRFEEQAKELNRCEHYARSPGEKARSLAERVIGLWRLGKADDALGAAELAIDAARNAGETDVLAVAFGRKAVFLTWRGELGAANGVLAEARDAARSSGPQIRGLLASYGAQLAAAEGDLDAKRARYAEAASLCDEAGDLRRAASISMNLADTLNRFGAFGEAEVALRAALERCRRVGYRVGEGGTLANLGYALVMLGRLDEAATALDEAERVAVATKYARVGVAVAEYRVRLALARSELDRAAADAMAAADRAEQAKLAGFWVRLLALAARAHLGAGRVPAALEASARALARYDELGSMEEGEIELFLVRAQALVAAGDAEGARQILERGGTRLDFVASRILDAEWRRRFLEEEPSHRALVAALSAARAHGGG